MKEFNILEGCRGKDRRCNKYKEICKIENIMSEPVFMDRNLNWNDVYPGRIVIIVFIPKLAILLDFLKIFSILQVIGFDYLKKVRFLVNRV